MTLEKCFNFSLQLVFSKLLSGAPGVYLFLGVVLTIDFMNSVVVDVRQRVGHLQVGILLKRFLVL